MQKFIEINGREYNIDFCARKSVKTFCQLFSLEKDEGEKIHDAIKQVYDKVTVADNNSITPADSYESSEQENPTNEASGTIADEVSKKGRKKSRKSKWLV
jgi:hypothetical protein